MRKKRKTGATSNTVLEKLEIKREVVLLQQEMAALRLREVHCPYCGRLLFKVDQDNRVIIRCHRCKHDVAVTI